MLSVRAPLRALIAAACCAAGLTSSPRPARALDPDRRITQYFIKNWKQDEHGLPINSLSSVTQTPDGFLWLASQEGLTRFDGASFRVFDTHSATPLAAASVLAVLPDHDGALWIGLDAGGLHRYERGAIRPSSIPLPNPSVTTLFEDRDHQLWIGTLGGVVSADHHADKPTITIYHESDGLTNGGVVAITQDNDGAIWIGSEGGLGRVDGLRVTMMGEDAGIPSTSVTSLLVDHEGTLWVGTKSAGLLKRPRGEARFSRVTIGDGAQEQYITALCQDRDKNIWIGTINGGILRYTRGGFSRLTRLLGEQIGSVARLFEDHEGNLWAATEGKGLIRINNGKAIVYGTPEGLPSRQVWSFHEGGLDEMWIGTGSGLARYAGGVIDAMSTKETVLYLAPSRDGGVWIGTDGDGILRIDNGRVHPVNALPRGVVGTVWAIHEDSGGDFWFATYPSGVARLHEGAITSIGPKDGLPSTPITRIAEGPPGTLWFPSAGGGLVRRSKEGTLRTFTRADGLPNDAIYSVLLEPDGAVWLGTEAGLAYLKDDRILGYITAKQGLYHDNFIHIVDDLAGNLWLTTNKGLFHIRKSDALDVIMGRAARLSSEVYAVVECNGGHPGGVRARDGRLWFATVHGALVVDPSAVRKNTVAPPIHIEEVYVNRAPVDLAARRELPEDSRDFSFFYTAPSFTAPEKLRFRYRLIGFDNDWIDAGDRRVAFYTNLAPGAYTFVVTADNEDGVPSEASAELSFTLAQHYYQTAPFQAAVVIGLLFVGAAAASLRLRGVRLRERELKRKVDERTAELARANEMLGSTLTAVEERDARLLEDLEQARQFQQRILPSMPESSGLRFAAVYEPAELVGGDLYDVCEIEPGTFRVFIADTTGHGVQASLRTMVLKTEYDRVKHGAAGPGAALSELNTKIASVYPGLEMRCTAACFDVTIKGDGRSLVRYANAAHAPLLLASRGAVEEVYVRGAFLGMIEDAEYTEIERALGPGDRLVAYTDGICEQESPAGASFGLERVIKRLSERARGADETAADLIAAVEAFSEGRERDDDMLILCVEQRSLEGATGER